MNCTCPNCGHVFTVAIELDGLMTPLIQARHARGLTLAEVAEKVGISIRQIGRIERMKSSPRLVEAMKLSKLYKVPIDELWPEVPEDKAIPPEPFNPDAAEDEDEDEGEDNDYTAEVPDYDNTEAG